MAKKTNEAQEVPARASVAPPLTLTMRPYIGKGGLIYAHCAQLTLQTSVGEVRKGEYIIQEADGTLRNEAGAVFRENHSRATAGAAKRVTV